MTAKISQKLGDMAENAFDLRDRMMACLWGENVGGAVEKSQDYENFMATGEMLTSPMNLDTDGPIVHGDALRR